MVSKSVHASRSPGEILKESIPDHNLDLLNKVCEAGTQESPHPAQPCASSEPWGAEMKVQQFPSLAEHMCFVVPHGTHGTTIPLRVFKLCRHMYLGHMVHA